MRRDHPLNSQAATLAEWFGTTRTAGLVAAALLDGDAPATTASLSERTGLCRSAVFSALVRLGVDLDPGEIASDGRRYVLTPSGREDCLRAFADAATRDLAA